MLVFTFSVLDRKYLFWARLVQKNRMASLSWNIQILMIVFTCSDFDRKYVCWAHLVQRFKIVQSKNWYLDWFKYSELNGGVNSIYFRLEIPFFVQTFGPKNQIGQFKHKSGTWTNDLNFVLKHLSLSYIRLSLVYYFWLISYDVIYSWLQWFLLQ